MCGDCYLSNLSKTVNGYTIGIGVDDDHESPREDHTLGVLMMHEAAQRQWCASDDGTYDYRKRLDAAITARQNVGRGQADFIRYLRNFERSKVILPVVMTPDYDFAIGTGQQPRGTQWLGFLFDTADSRDLTRTGASSKADIEEELLRELGAFNDWQNNPCFQYMLYGPADDGFDTDCIDGACGFGSAEDALREAEWALREELRHAEALREEIDRLRTKRRTKTKK